MTKFGSLLLACAAALCWCQPASAVVVGFEYIAHIDDIQVQGSPPPGTLPAGVGNAVVGVFAFETSLAPDPGQSGPNIGFYTYQLPPPFSVHRVRFQLPTVVDFLFDNVSMVVLNDYPLLGLPYEQDELLVGSDRSSPVSAPSIQTYFALTNLANIGDHVGPFNSIAPPAVPPKLGDFNDLHDWSFTISSPGTVPFEQSWSITATGRVVALDAVDLPEPPMTWLLALGLLAIARRRTRH